MRHHSRYAAAPLLLAMAVLTLAPAPAIAADEVPAERLASPILPNFVVGYQAANATESIREEVSKGQTVEAWTRMITTQRFTGLSSRITPAAMVARIGTMIMQSCPGASTTPVVTLTVSGQPAARFQANCPSNKGAPESFVFLAVAGATDLHVKQAAARGSGAATSLGWGDKLLAATVLCTAQSSEGLCRADRVP